MNTEQIKQNISEKASSENWDFLKNRFFTIVYSLAFGLSVWRISLRDLSHASTQLFGVIMACATMSVLFDFAYDLWMERKGKRSLTMKIGVNLLCLLESMYVIYLQCSQQLGPSTLFGVVLVPLTCVYVVQYCDDEDGWNMYRGLFSAGTWFAAAMWAGLIALVLMAAFYLIYFPISLMTDLEEPKFFSHLLYCAIPATLTLPFFLLALIDEKEENEEKEATKDLVKQVTGEGKAEGEAEGKGEGEKAGDEAAEGAEGAEGAEIVAANEEAAEDAGAEIVVADEKAAAEGAEKPAKAAKKEAKEEEGESHSILMSFLGYVFLVMYLYMIIIVSRFELPRGYISYICCACTALAFYVYALTYDLPLTPRWKKFSNLIPWLVLPLQVLFSVAIGRRLMDYGVTIDRVYVLLINVWCYLVCFYLLLSKGKGLRWIPAVFMAGYFVVSSTPMSVQNYVRWQLRQDVKNHVGRVDDKVEYLRENYGMEALRGIGLSPKKLKEAESQCESDEYFENCLRESK